MYDVKKRSTTWKSFQPGPIENGTASKQVLKQQDLWAAELESTSFPFWMRYSGGAVGSSFVNGKFITRKRAKRRVHFKKIEIRGAKTPQHKKERRAEAGSCKDFRRKTLDVDGPSEKPGGRDHTLFAH